MPRDKNENLVPQDKRTKTEQRNVAKKGGIASGEARRKKRSIREAMKSTLSMSLPPDNVEALREKLSPDISKDLTLSDLVAVGQIKSAAEGNTAAAKLLIDMEEDERAEDRAFYIPAEKIASSFCDVNRSISDCDYQEYVFKGGRASTKSSYISMKIIELIMNNEQLHAVVMRRVADTLRQSVYTQMKWALSALDLERQFKATFSPMEITRISTGQKIYFRGADDEAKLKSIKTKNGYIGILWFEELDNFAGDEQIRSITQSVIRGGDTAFIFKSFNPPITASNWANEYVLKPKENRLVHHSTYLTVPSKWIGKAAIEEAEWLKVTDERAYNHEYMGEVTGTGANVFENVTVKTITDNEIASFDRCYYGIDWGWYPDPTHFCECYYNAAQRRLWIFAERRYNKIPNEVLAQELDYWRDCRITADNSDQKSIADMRAYGFAHMRAAIKGPGSVEYGMKWLSSLKEIIIDPDRCPCTAEEFVMYEYERDRDDKVISAYPDANNHAIDAVRYALEEVWRRRGQ